MRTLIIALLAPSLDNEPRFPNQYEEPWVQAAVAEHASERLVVTIPPGASRLNELRADPARRDPVLDPIAEEFGSVVALDHARNAADLHQLLKHPSHAVQVQEPSCLDPVSRPRELVDHRQESKASPVWSVTKS